MGLTADRLIRESAADTSSVASSLKIELRGPDLDAFYIVQDAYPDSKVVNIQINLFRVTTYVASGWISRISSSFLVSIQLDGSVVRVAEPARKSKLNRVW